LLSCCRTNTDNIAVRYSTALEHARIDCSHYLLPVSRHECARCIFESTSAMPVSPSRLPNRRADGRKEPSRPSRVGSPSLPAPHEAHPCDTSTTVGGWCNGRHPPADPPGYVAVALWPTCGRGPLFHQATKSAKMPLATVGTEPTAVGYSCPYSQGRGRDRRSAVR
jgi:hypothetical protein